MSREGVNCVTHISLNAYPPPGICDCVILQSTPEKSIPIKHNISTIHIFNRCIS